ncbi:splicing regulator SDE2 isoform X1 [Antennarius striatus]|uniref:splicing regulator SDE2 isoform X1 n=1 Tax=Antennarius striatus TaxID=241820 RepID=UPI0035B18ACD
MEVFVSAPGSRFSCLTFPEGSAVSDVLGRFVRFPCVSPGDFYVIRNGQRAEPDDPLQHGAVYHLEPRLRGGKGGFGSMLRALGAQIEKTTNREACRDLSGRRLRDVNHEKEMADWLKQQAEREAQKEQRRLERLQRKLEAPQHRYSDAHYQQQCHDLSERLEDSVLKGLQASAGGQVGAGDASATKRPNADESEQQRKRRKKTAECFWTGVELMSSEDDEDESPSTSTSGGAAASMTTPPEFPGRSSPPAPGEGSSLAPQTTRDEGRSPAGATGEEGRSPAGATGEEGRSPAGANGHEERSPAGANGDEGRSPAGANGDEERSPAGANGEEGRSPAGANGDEGRSPAGANGDEGRSPAGANGDEGRSPAGANGDEERSPAGANGDEGRSPAGANGDEGRSPAGANGDEERSPAGANGDEGRSPAGANGEEGRSPARANGDERSPAGATGEEGRSPAGANGEEGRSPARASTDGPMGRQPEVCLSGVTDTYSPAPGVPVVLMEPRPLQLGVALSSLSQLEALGLDVLKQELMSRGLKCGGTLRERATRLLAVRGLTPDQIDPALLAKPGKTRRK